MFWLDTQNIGDDRKRQRRGELLHHITTVTLRHCIDQRRTTGMDRIPVLMDPASGEQTGEPAAYHGMTLGWKPRHEPAQ